MPRHILVMMLSMAEVESSTVDGNPLLKTLPPATDYLNYLIVVEHNLSKEQLPTLHSVLQDTTLTANIGWDLVHLLLPFLPESRECLQDIARLGNPREVVLKVIELLVDIKGVQENGDDEGGDEEGGAEGGDRDVDPQKSEPTSDDHVPDEAAAHHTSQDAKQKDPDLQAQRYVCLIEMLSILHPRIKTKYPSRFLTASLQAVLPAYTAVAQNSSATGATLDMVKHLYPSARPRLPPRRSSSHVPTASTVPTVAPDPEGQDVPLGTDEAALQARLLQSFLTFVAEGYVSRLKAYEDIPGMAWSPRYYEKTHPDKHIPGRSSYLAMFVEEEEELHLRDTLLGQCLAISRDLKIHPREFLSTTAHEDPVAEDDDEELPSKASDVPLSRAGSLYLLCALAASSSLFGAPSTIPQMKIFPDFAGIVQYCLSTDTSSQLGREPEDIIDAVLFLGNVILEQNPSLQISDDKLFNQTLQRLSLLSANTPSAVLRYQAHLLISSILHRSPSPNSRLAFIKDTLEHCPYESLKASAVGWLKDEILNAQSHNAGSLTKESDSPSIFSTSAILQTTAPLLLQDPSEFINKERGSFLSGASAQAERFGFFQQQLPFILAVLNLLYLLLSSPDIFNALQIKSLGKDFDIVGYCDRLRAASLLFQGWIASDQTSAGEGGGADEERNANIAELQLLDQTIERVMESVGAAGLS